MILVKSTGAAQLTVLGLKVMPLLAELGEGELTELLQPARIKHARARRAAPSFEPDLDRASREEDIS